MGSRGKVLQSDIRRAVEGFARPYLAPSWYTLSDVDQAALVAASEAKPPLCTIGSGSVALTDAGRAMWAARHGAAS